MIPPDADTPDRVTIESLIWQDEFRAWVLHPTEALTSYWQNWQQLHPDHISLVGQASEIVRALQVENRPITQADIQRIIAITRQQLEHPATAVIPVRSSSWAWPLAASIAIVITVGIGWLIQSNRRVLTGSKNAEVSTRYDVIQESQSNRLIKLPDGSTVQLGPASKIRYPPEFSADRREVFLTGEATFDIKRQTEQPFLVYANGTVTRVLGTRFIVQALSQSSRVFVKVLSGKVSVLSQKEWQRAQQQTGYQPSTIIVTPNQQVVYERANELMHKSLVDQPRPVISRSEPVNFNFIKTPVARVLTTLEKAYGIPINFDEATFRNCQITAPLSDESLFEKLSIICETIGARYEVVEAQIIITGHGCAL